MKVEIWSDFVCPFCYIGKRNFEKALDDFDQKENVAIVWRSFQLDVEMKQVPGQSVHEYLAKRKGVSTEKGKEMNDYMAGIAKEAGLNYDFDNAVINNTMNAHRLSHLAAKHGLQWEIEEALFAAYYAEGKDIGEFDTLIAIGVSVGINESEIKKMYETDLFVEAVRLDQQESEEVGVQGVPFFLFNEKYAVSGAQPVHIFKQVLEKARDEEAPVDLKAPGGFCTSDGVCNEG